MSLTQDADITAYMQLTAVPKRFRRDQVVEREAWLMAKEKEGKHTQLFELETLLKGLIAFRNPRNHPRQHERHALLCNYKENLSVVGVGLQGVMQLLRELVGKAQDSWFAEAMFANSIIDDSERHAFLHSTETTESVEQALRSLEQQCRNGKQLTDSLVSVGHHLSFKTFDGVLGMLEHPILRNPYFSPCLPLEFHAAFDRLPSGILAMHVEALSSEAARQLSMMLFLSLFRAIKQLELVDRYALDRYVSRGYLILSVVRSEVRSVSTHLLRQLKTRFAEHLDEGIATVRAHALHVRYQQLLAEAQKHLQLQQGLEAIATRLQLEMTRVFECELAFVDQTLTPTEMRKQLIQAAETLRGLLQSSVLFLARTLGIKSNAQEIFSSKQVEAEQQMQLRQDAWIFAQMLRGFGAKVAASRNPETCDKWSKLDTHRFVPEFMLYFKSIGCPILRLMEYSRASQFRHAMQSVIESDVLDPARVQLVVHECESLYSFLQGQSSFDTDSTDATIALRKRQQMASTLKQYLQARAFMSVR